MKIKIMKRFIVAIGLFGFLIPNILLGQSEAIDSFEEKADGYNLFVYQSVIRMLNRDKNEDFNKLIKDLDHLKILVTDSIGSESNVLYNNLEKGLEEEGYEQLMSFDNPDSKAVVFSKDGEDGVANWVVIFGLGEMSGLFEMKGSIDTKYLGALSSLNVEKLQSILPLAGEEILDIRHDLEEDE